jgi:hypothetical protein
MLEVGAVIKLMLVVAVMEVAENNWFVEAKQARSSIVKLVLEPFLNLVRHAEVAKLADAQR